MRKGKKKIVGDRATAKTYGITRTCLLDSLAALKATQKQWQKQSILFKFIAISQHDTLLLIVFP